MQNKEVINQNTGANLGRIVDIDVNNEGYVNYFVVGSLKMMKKFSTSEYKINYKDITKIGTDVILVDLK